MKRSLKLIRNILLIVIIISIIGYTKQYRFTPVDVAKVFGETIFLDNPDIKQLSTNNQYTTFLLEEDNVLACSVVEKVNGFVYHPANFGSTFITLNNSDADIESFTSKCSNTYERYFNISYQDDLILGNLLEFKSHNYNYSKPVQIYQVKDTFANQFYSEFETLNNYFDMNYKEFIEDPSNHKITYYYTDLTKSFSSKSRNYSSQMHYIIDRIDVNENRSTLNFLFDYRIKDQELLTVLDVLNIEQQLYEKSFTEEAFGQFETIKTLEELSENRIIEILNQTMQKMNINMEVTKVEILETSTPDTDEPNTQVINDKTSLEYFLEYNKISSVTERNDLSYDVIKELTINQVLTNEEDFELLIKTSDEKLVHLDTYSFTEFGPTVITPDGNQVQVYFRISSEEEFNSIISSRPYLDEIIEKIILESYTEITTKDEISSVVQKMHQSVVDNFGVIYNTISVSIVGKMIVEE